MTGSGILNVNKEAGWTSFQVVAMVRKGSGIRKVGHAGTLDPTATGILLICLGQATRVTQYLMELPKTYLARVILGTTTDTYDTEGQTLASGDFSDVSEGSLRASLQHFVGHIQQVPPSFSALKVNGQPAHRLARKGQPPTLKARPVRVDRIELLRFAPPAVDIEVRCGKGTYIRSLAHDLGQMLGCGAHLGSLVRTQVGPFTLDTALTLPDLQRALNDGAWQAPLLPIDSGLDQIPAITLSDADAESVRHGRPLPAGLHPATAALYRAYGEDGTFLAILAPNSASGGGLRPEKVFPQA